MNITKDDMSSDDCRIIYENELFPSKENQVNQPIFLNVFNVDYYPSERGPWNFDTSPSSYSSGISYEGYLNNPDSRWGGIMRKIEKTDRKIKFLDFWILSPFSNFPDADGKLVFDMGQISEDVLKDGLISAENTTEGQNTETVWGLVKPQNNYYSFPSDIDREKYDTGLDGLQSNIENSYSEDENNYFAEYLLQINSLCSPIAYNSIVNDPSGDDYHPFFGEDYDQLNYKVRDRYKNVMENENNSPIREDNPYTIIHRNPNTEDINKNGILENINNYREYTITINQASMQVGLNYLIDIYIANPTRLENGSTVQSKFYHFRIPLEEYTNIYGSPDVSVNPESIRMYFTGFASPINLRFIHLMFTNDLYEIEH
jgi:cell surface protein SprA